MQYPNFVLKIDIGMRIAGTPWGWEFVVYPW